MFKVEVIHLDGSNDSWFMTACHPCIIKAKTTNVIGITSFNDFKSDYAKK